jgi:hypothetical protein
MNRALRALAGGVVALLAAGGIALGSVAPAHAEPGVVPESFDLVVGQDAGRLVIANAGDFHYVGWHDEGELPSGLTPSHDGETFGLVGTPTESGIFPFRILIQWDASAPAVDYTVELRVASPPVFATPSQLPDATLGVYYELQISALPFADYERIGSLHGGMSFNSGGVLSGTPTRLGASTMTVMAKNAAGVDMQTFTFNVVSPAPVWQTTALPQVEPLIPYEVALDVSDAESIAVTAGALPRGLSIVGKSLVGTTTDMGTFNFTLTATGPGGMVSQPFSVQSASITPVVWETLSIPPLTVGVPFETQLFARHAFYYDLLPPSELPAGLTLVQNGRLHGTPTVAGSAAFTVSAGNHSGGSLRQFTIVVNPAAPVWQTTELPALRVDEAAMVPLDASDTASFRLLALPG